uniref:Uncharacterized protein n=1 Tax=Glossina morsitans morsitans TaxID=37546 RepID=A0A1B0FMZ2_GLOMM
MDSRLPVAMYRSKACQLQCIKIIPPSRVDYVTNQQHQQQQCAGVVPVSVAASVLASGTQVTNGVGNTNASNLDPNFSTPPFSFRRYSLLHIFARDDNCCTYLATLERQCAVHMSPSTCSCGTAGQ